MNWRSLFGAFYAQDVDSRESQADADAWDSAASSRPDGTRRMAAPPTTPSPMESSPASRASRAAPSPTNNAKFLPEPRIGIAWSPYLGKTVVRAGFGMYNELQDALGYRMDQNAPFNPTYSIAALPVSQLPIDPQAPPPPKALLVPGGVQPNLKMPTLISYSLRSRAGDYPEYVVDAAATSVRTATTKSSASTPTRRSQPSVRRRRVRRSIPRLSRRRWPARRFPRARTTFRPERQRRIPRSPTPGPGSRSATAATTRCKSTSTIASATVFRSAAFTPGRRRWTTAIR